MQPLSELIDYQLHQKLPNPFNPNTSISFTLKRSTNVRLEGYMIVLGKGWNNW